MAERLLRAGAKKKLGNKRVRKIADNDSIVLVGTYKDKQLNWIKKNQYYNYPIDDADKLDLALCGKIKELWLYAGAKAKRYCFKAEFVGIQTKSEFLEANPTYKKLGVSRHNRYMVFKTEYFDLGNLLEGVKVFVRAKDFAGGRAKAVAKAVKQYNEGGEFGILADYLPKEISKLPKAQLRVCEAAVQLEFGVLLKMESVAKIVPFPAPPHPRFTFIDLFAGIGGFRIAMQRCGGKCVFSSEFDLFAMKTYEANFGDIPFGDITKPETHNYIPENFDVVCAGFPCQAFSLAGKRLGFKDMYKGMSRGTLFAEVVKICESHRPKAIFCENVKGLYIHDRGNTFRVIKNEFESIGYRFYYKILNSMDFGVPQHRERIYMVAFRNDYAGDDYEFNFPAPIENDVTLNDIREHDVSAKYYLSDVYLNTLRCHRARHEAAGHGFGYVIRRWDDVSGAIVCGGMGRETNLVMEENGTPIGLTPVTHIKGHINQEGVRKLTPREWARLQGFPEQFRFVVSDVHLYKQFGNSVSIPVVEAISARIIDRIEQVDYANNRNVAKI